MSNETGYVKMNAARRSRMGRGADIGCAHVDFFISWGKGCHSRLKVKKLRRVHTILVPEVIVHHEIDAQEPHSVMASCVLDRAPSRDPCR